MSGTVHISLEQASGPAVSDVMMREPRSVGPDMPLADVRDTFFSPRMKLLLVTDGERFLGTLDPRRPAGRAATARSART